MHHSTVGLSHRAYPLPFADSDGLVGLRSVEGAPRTTRRPARRAARGSRRSSTLGARSMRRSTRRAQHAHHASRHWLTHSMWYSPHAAHSMWYSPHAAHSMALSARSMALSARSMALSARRSSARSSHSTWRAPHVLRATHSPSDCTLVFPRGGGPAWRMHEHFVCAEFCDWAKVCGNAIL